MPCTASVIRKACARFPGSDWRAVTNRRHYKIRFQKSVQDPFGPTSANTYENVPTSLSICKQAFDIQLLSNDASRQIACLTDCMFFVCSIFRFFEKFWLGGAAPQTPRFLTGGAKPPQTPSLKRSSLAFDRGGQTGPPRSNALFFGAADDPQNDPVRQPSIKIYLRAMCY